MSARHTPGPWFVDAKFVRTHGATRAGVKDGMVAQVNKGPLTDDEHAANLRLIAAAPDLLQALGEIVSTIECDPRLYNLVGVERYRQARAAIANAEGGAK